MKNNNTMKMENKIKDIIDMLEEALSFEDWRKVENAQKEKAPFENELNRVLIHGILHLCGFKDKSINEKKIMRQKEDEMLIFFDHINN